MGDTKSLQDRLASLRGVTVKLSVEDAAEVALRDQITAEEDRIAGERAAKRRLDNARLLDTVKSKHPDRLWELMDLDHAGVYVIGNPPTMIGETLQEAIKTKGSTSSLDTANFVLGSLGYPDPMTNGPEIRDKLDEYPFAAQSLSNVAFRLGGLKIEERAKK